MNRIALHILTLIWLLALAPSAIHMGGGLAVVACAVGLFVGGESARAFSLIPLLRWRLTVLKLILLLAVGVLGLLFVRITFHSRWLPAPTCAGFLALGLLVAFGFSAFAALRPARVLESFCLYVVIAWPWTAHRGGFWNHPRWLGAAAQDLHLEMSVAFKLIGVAAFLLALLLAYSRARMLHTTLGERALPVAVLLPALLLAVTTLVVPLTRLPSPVPPAPLSRSASEDSPDNQQTPPPPANEAQAVALIHIAHGPCLTPTWEDHLLLDGFFFRAHILSNLVGGDQCVAATGGPLLDEPSASTGFPDAWAKTNVMVRVFTTAGMSAPMPVGAIVSGTTRATTSTVWPRSTEFEFQMAVDERGRSRLCTPLAMITNTPTLARPGWSQEELSELLTVPTNFLPVVSPTIVTTNRIGDALRSVLRWCCENMVVVDVATGLHTNIGGNVVGNIGALARAQTFLLRRAGIPARLVEGYRFHETDNMVRDRFVLTTAHKFSFPEIYYSGVWVPVPARYKVESHSAPPPPSTQLVDLPDLESDGPHKLAQRPVMPSPPLILVVPALLMFAFILEASAFYLRYTIQPRAVIDNPTVSPQRSASRALGLAADLSARFGRHRSFGATWETLWNRAGRQPSTTSKAFAALATLNARVVGGELVTPRQIAVAYERFAGALAWQYLFTLRCVGMAECRRLINEKLINRSKL